MEWVYIIGIESRPGKGRYRDTFIVTLAPRFQLHNQSQYKIQVAQRCYANTILDPGAEATHLQVNNYDRGHAAPIYQLGFLTSLIPL